MLDGYHYYNIHFFLYCIVIRSLPQLTNETISSYRERLGLLRVCVPYKNLLQRLRQNLHSFMDTFNIDIEQMAEYESSQVVILASSFIPNIL